MGQALRELHRSRFSVKMPPKKATRQWLGDWQCLTTVPEELILSYEYDSEQFQKSLYAASAYITRMPDQFHLGINLPEVSQFHAEIQWDPKTKKWKIKDLESTGGTKVNGRKVRCDRFTGLKSGDVILLSNVLKIKVKVCLDLFGHSVHCVVLSCW